MVMIKIANAENDDDTFGTWRFVSGNDDAEATDHSCLSRKKKTKKFIIMKKKISTTQGFDDSVSFSRRKSRRFFFSFRKKKTSKSTLVDDDWTNDTAIARKDERKEIVDFFLLCNFKKKNNQPFCTYRVGKIIIIFFQIFFFRFFFVVAFATEILLSRLFGFIFELTRDGEGEKAARKGEKAKRLFSFPSAKSKTKKRRRRRFFYQSSFLSLNKQQKNGTFSIAEELQQPENLNHSAL